METGSRKWGRPYLTRKFYSLIGETMADQDRAGDGQARRPLDRRRHQFHRLATRSIGRHWGAIEHHPFLHFEICYYQAIEFAIAHKLKRVEAGAQGEHKLARGYLPVTTYSAHYIADPALRRAIADYLVRERAYVEAAGEELAAAGAVPQGFGRAWNRTDLCCRDAPCRAMIPTTSSRKSCAANCPVTRSMRTTRSLAFLDIMPRAPGHTLVLPKAPARNLLDVDAGRSRRSRRGRAEDRQGRHDGVRRRRHHHQQFNEGAGGQVVFHLHVHVIPRKAGVAMKPPASEKEKPEVLKEQAARLMAALASRSAWARRIGRRAGPRGRLSPPYGFAAGSRSSEAERGAETAPLDFDRAGFSRASTSRKSRWAPPVRRPASCRRGRCRPQSRRYHSLDLVALLIFAHALRDHDGGEVGGRYHSVRNCCCRRPCRWS